MSYGSKVLLKAKIWPFLAASPERFQRSIPLVIMTEDMVAGGYVVSLARPNANITGVSLMSPELDGKRQDILIEAVPDARRVAVLADSNVANLRWAKHSLPPIADVAPSRAARQKAARRRLLNSNLMIVDQTAINAGFDFRR